ncbi:MAG: nucleoside deaminase [Alphaproteobacteria bacterium]
MFANYKFMHEAINKAKEAYNQGEVPVGAVIVDYKADIIIAKAFNKIEVSKDPTAHAEILAIRAACKLKNSPRISDCDIYITLEPCSMCAQAIAYARFRRVYFGAYDEKGGGIVNGPKIFNNKNINHVPEIYSGICQKESEELLKFFFQNLRK